MNETQITEDTLRVLSHEIKNPLTILLCALANLNSGAVGDLNQSQSKLVKTMDKTCQRLKRIVSHFLDAGSMNGQAKSANVQQVLQPFIEGHEVISQKNGIQFEASLHGLENAKVNFLVLEHVLQNFLDNAFRFAKSHVEVKAKFEEGFVHLVVKDDGPGVAFGERELVFEKHYQSPLHKNKSCLGSVGLGLFLCKKLVESANGHLWVDGDQGAHFHLLLPCLKSLEDLTPQPSQKNGENFLAENGTSN